jgi:hypothetical protein
MTLVNKDFVVNNGLQITGYLTSVGGASPLNGQLLIGDLTNNRWSVGSLTPTNGATVAVGAGTITIGTNATNANTASTIVARDSSGNFSAGTISANFSGGTVSGTTASFTSNVSVGGNFTRSVTNAVAAAGTTQATATALVTDINYITSGTGGVILPAINGATFFIVNNSGAAINVYPPVGDTINFLAVNTALSMANQSSLLCVCINTTWFTVNATYA